MSKIQHVKKSRKEYRCSKCGCTIPVGSSYLRGELNFSRPIIRCTDCGLKHWEVTTSEYQLAIGPIAYEWQERYGVCEDAVDSIHDDLYDIQADLEERRDNMPESLENSPTWELLQERIDGIDGVISDLDNISIDDVKSEAVDNVMPSIDGYDEDAEYDYDTEIEKGGEVSEKLVDEFNAILTSAIEAALENLSTE